MKARIFSLIVALFSLTSFASAATDSSFELRNFATCQEFQSTMTDILTAYSDRYWYPYPMPTLRDNIQTATPARGNVGAESSSQKSPISQTNTQVQ